VLQYCLSISKYRKNVINLFNKYDACVGDVVDTDVIFVIVRQLSTVEYTSVASLFHCRQWSD